MVDRCVICGEIIPEGTQVCPKCVRNSVSRPQLYAVKHRQSGRFVTGTDFNYCPPKQILSDYDSPLLLTGYNLLSELKHRKISTRHYMVVEVTVKERK